MSYKSLLILYSVCVIDSSASFVCFVHAPFLFAPAARTEIYTLSLHDALPITWWSVPHSCGGGEAFGMPLPSSFSRSEEHTSELQSPMYLVCRLQLEKKKYYIKEQVTNTIRELTTRLV